MSENSSLNNEALICPFTVIDTHVHAYPDAIAGKVVSKLGLKGDTLAAEDVTARGLVAAARRAGVALSLNLPIATKVQQANDINAWVRNLPTGLLSFATVHPDMTDIPAALRELKALGFKGLKFHPEFQQFRLDDPRLLSCWEEMRALGLVAYFHAGADRSFTPPFRSTPAMFRDFVRRFPGLRVVAAHMGGFQMWEECEAVLCGEDILMDLAHTMDFIPDEFVLRLIRRHGANRVLFATDSPWRSPADELRHFMRLELEDRERELILHENAEALLGLDPSFVRKSAHD